MEETGLIPHDFGSGSGIITEVGKYAYKRPIDIFREVIANALDQYDPHEKNKMVEIKINVSPDHDLEIVDYATGIQDYKDFIKAGSEEGKRIGDRVSSYSKINPEIVGQKHIGKISFLFASETEKVEFHSNNGEVGMILVMRKGGFESPIHKDSTKVLPHRGLKVVIKNARKEVLSERTIKEYIAKVFAIRIARETRILVNNNPTHKPDDFDCSHETELFSLDILDSEGKPIIVRGQLNAVNKPKANNIDIFVKHIFVESDTYEYQVQGWVNVDHFELEIGRNRVYEDARIYPQFRKKFFEFLDSNFEKTSQPTDTEIKGLKQLQEMAESLVKLFCELNPDMIQPLISGPKSSQGLAGKSQMNDQVIDKDTWNIIKGVFDKDGIARPREGMPINGKSKGGEKHDREIRKISVLETNGKKDFLVKSANELSEEKASIKLKFIPMKTNHSYPIIYFEPPNRIVLNTARASSEIITTSNPKDPARKARVLPLLTMAIVDMFLSTSQLPSHEWKKYYEQLLDKGWSSN
jgi:hypothetical protein